MMLVTHPEVPVRRALHDGRSLQLHARAHHLPVEPHELQLEDGARLGSRAHEPRRPDEVGVTVSEEPHDILEQGRRGGLHSLPAREEEPGLALPRLLREHPGLVRLPGGEQGPDVLHGQWPRVGLARSRVHVEQALVQHQPALPALGHGQHLVRGAPPLPRGGETHCFHVASGIDDLQLPQVEIGDHPEPLVPLGRHELHFLGGHLEHLEAPPVVHQVEGVARFVGRGHLHEDPRPLRVRRGHHLLHPHALVADALDGEDSRPSLSTSHRPARPGPGDQTQAWSPCRHGATRLPFARGCSQEPSTRASTGGGGASLRAQPATLPSNRSKALTRNSPGESGLRRRNQAREEVVMGKARGGDTVLRHCRTSAPRPRRACPPGRRPALSHLGRMPPDAASRHGTTQRQGLNDRD